MLTSNHMAGMTDEFAKIANWEPTAGTNSNGYPAPRPRSELVASARKMAINGSGVAPRSGFSPTVAKMMRMKKQAAIKLGL